jgi:hypothetical protein
MPAFLYLHMPCMLYALYAFNFQDQNSVTFHTITVVDTGIPFLKMQVLSQSIRDCNITLSVALIYHSLRCLYYLKVSFNLHILDMEIFVLCQEPIQ